MELLIRQFHRVRASFGLMFPIDPPAPRGHLFILRFYLPNSVYLFTPDLPKNLAFCMLWAHSDILQKKHDRKLGTVSKDSLPGDMAGKDGHTETQLRNSLYKPW